MDDGDGLNPGRQFINTSDEPTLWGIGDIRCNIARSPSGLGSISTSVSFLILLVEIADGYAAPLK